MLEIRAVSQFKKDLRLAQRRGNDVVLLRKVIQRLANEEALELKFRDHSLKGNYIDCRECHIQPDFLLVFRLTESELVLVRAGTHSDLFR